jgi:hypothetical protein
VTKLVAEGSVECSPEFRLIPSLRDYLLVSQQERRIERYHWNEDGTWTLRDVREGGRVELTSIGCALSVERLMRSPEMKARLTEKTGDYWMTWVGLWKDLRLVPGQTWETTMDDGASAVYQHHGPVPGEPGLVRFSASIVLEGDVAKAEMADVLGESTRQLDVTDLPPVERVRREAHASADTDPLTLRPRRARLETIFDVKMQGIPAISKREVNDYELDW